MLQTADGGYFVAASTWSFGSGEMDVWLLRMDSLGDTIWTRTYGWEETIDDPRCALVTSDSCYVVAGYTGRQGSTDLLVLKVNEEGDTLWCARTSSDVGYAYAIRETPDSGFILVGGHETPGLDDLWIVRMSAAGEILWTRAYGGASRESAWDVEPAGDGGWYVVGQTQSFGAGWSDAWLLRTDSLGDTLWTRTYGDDGTQSARSMTRTRDGGLIIVGATRVVSPGTYPDVWIVGIDRNGDTLWTRTYGDSYEDCAWVIEQDPTGGYFVAGTWGWFSPEQGSFWLARIDEEGDTAWSRTFGGPGQEICLDGQPSADGGYVLTGWTDSWGAGGADVYTVRTSSVTGVSEGSKLSPKRWRVPSPVITGTLPLVSGADADLLDITGRHVMDLAPGENDIRHLSPGVYFVRPASGMKREAAGVHKVVVTR